MENKNLELQRAIKYPFIDMDDVATQKWFKGIVDKAANGDLTARGEFKAYVDAYLKLSTKAEHGRSLGEAVYKNSPQGMPADPAKIMINDVTQNELNLDTVWQSFYEFVNVSGTSAAEIIDIFSTTNGWENYAPGKKLQLSTFGDADFTQVKEARYGVGYAMLRRWIEQDQWWNVNRIMQKIMLDNQRYKATAAYTAIAGLTGNFTTCAGTSLDQRVAAFNEAYVTLVKRLSGKGFGMSGSTRVYLLTAPENLSIVNQVIGRAKGGETNNTVVEWPITVQTTFNTLITSTPETSKLGAFLYVPALKNKWVTFGSLMTEQSKDFTTDSVEIYAQEYFNHTENADQVQIVRLEA